MKRSKFSLSNYKLCTMPMGKLVPIGLQEILPGDSIQAATSALLRVIPLAAPVMHPVRVRIHHWFVPHRLVWEDWEDFITGGPDGFDDSAFPVKDGHYTTPGDLLDYLGIPPSIGVGRMVSVLPLRGYQLIYNNFYRDQDLMAAAAISLSSGTDNTTSATLQNVAWEKDYFTSARPWVQKGPDITIPLASTAPVEGTGQPTWNVGIGPGASSPLYWGAGTDNVKWNQSNPGANQAAAWVDPALQVDLSAATSVGINALRQAFALQRFEEARARYGSRYTEYLRYLGVRSSDARLQRPEYLGGGKQTIQFSEVLQTGVDAEDSGVGNLTGHGIAAMRSNRFRRFFEEHGYMFTLCSVLPKTMYAQGIPRTWNRRIKEDFFQRELQHIGQQPILNRELYAPGASPEGIFGYQDRYDEYRRSESSVAGAMRDSLDFWHYARIFESAPTLNGSFVTANPTTRVYQVTEGADPLICMFNHSIQARRLVAGSGKSFIY